MMKRGRRCLEVHKVVAATEALEIKVGDRIVFVVSKEEAAELALLLQEMSKP